MREKDTDVKKLQNLLTKAGKDFPRLIYFGDNFHVFYDRGAFTSKQTFYVTSEGAQIKESATLLFSSEDINRKDVIDALITVEFLLTELIIYHLQIPRRNVYDFLELLDNVNLRGKFEFSRKLKVIDRSTYNILMKTKNVRNEFAHSLLPEHVHYKGKPLTDAGGNAFAEDVNKATGYLVKKIKERQPRYADLIKELEEMTS